MDLTSFIAGIIAGIIICLLLASVYTAGKQAAGRK